jgi:agmatine deiminase
MREHNPHDENYAALEYNLQWLQQSRDQDGRLLEVVPLPMPAPLYHDNHRLPASYANFYIANGLVVVPQYDDPSDQPVLDTLGSLFPDRQIRGLRAVDLAWGLGAFHCITQQEPVAHSIGR